MSREKMLEGARKVMDCCCVKKGEKIAIITDTGRSIQISLALLEAARECEAEPVIMMMDPVLPGAELPHLINVGIKDADVLIMPTSTSLGYSRGIREACLPENHARSMALSEWEEDNLMEGGIKADFRALKPVAEKINDIFTEGKQIKVTTPAGTDIEASIMAREAVANTCFADAPGVRMGLPDTEVYIAPVEQSINGTIVVDASCSGGIGIIQEPIRITVKNGKAIAIEGGKEADQLRKLLEEANDPDAYQVAEIAVGLNPECRITGAITEDEGKYGTCHMALGYNNSFGGVSKAPIHIDMVQWKPTVIIDGEKIFELGEKLV